MGVAESSSNAILIAEAVRATQRLFEHTGLKELEVQNMDQRTLDLMAKLTTVANVGWSFKASYQQGSVTPRSEYEVALL